VRRRRRRLCAAPVPTACRAVRRDRRRSPLHATSFPGKPPEIMRPAVSYVAGSERRDSGSVERFRCQRSPLGTSQSRFRWLSRNDLALVRQPRIRDHNVPDSAVAINAPAFHARAVPRDLVVVAAMFADLKRHQPQVSRCARPQTRGTSPSLRRDRYAPTLGLKEAHPVSEPSDAKRGLYQGWSVGPEPSGVPGTVFKPSRRPGAAVRTPQTSGRFVKCTEALTRSARPSRTGTSGAQLPIARSPGS
jgi:hypothetical protein